MDHAFENLGSEAYTTYSFDSFYDFSLWDLSHVTSATDVFKNCLPNFQDWSIYIPDSNDNKDSCWYYGDNSSYISPCEGHCFTVGLTCMAAGTLITMADGSNKPIEEIQIGDVVRTFDHETGEISSAPVYYYQHTPSARNVFTLYFENDVEITLISEHGFYDRSSNKYVFINADNAKDYYGHEFYNANEDSWIKLVSSKRERGVADAYAIITSNHLNAISNGLLSMCDGMIKPVANIFEYDTNMKIDPVKKASDIETYGTISYAEMLEGCSEADFNNYNMMYLPIAVGKGYTTWDRIAYRNRKYGE